MPTTTKQKVYNLILLDESGSMASIKTQTIQGFNEIVQTVKGVEQLYPNQEHLLSVVSFNGLGRKTLHWNEPVSSLEIINATNYNPSASTPLFDAIGYSVCRLNTELQNASDYHVLVTIFTDGEENASQEYRGQVIKQLIQELKQKNWAFTYIGTDHDVEKLADTIAIKNVMLFDKTEEGLEVMFQKEARARMAYSRKVEKRQNPKDDFYDL